MKIRKAILTGGGRATRLYPITTTINKHLLPLANKAMIFHAIEKAVAAGIKEIFINVNPGETDLQQHIGDGGHWGIQVKFFEQTGGPQGIAHVVKLAQPFIGDEPFMFYLSDNILLANLKEMVETFEMNPHDCMLAFARVPDPERFGVPVFDGDNRLVDVIEKPSTPPNNFAQTGIYLYGPKIFFHAFDHIEKSARGEYEISSIHSYLLKNGYRVGHREITGWWKDTGKVEDLLLANQLLLDESSWDTAEKVRIGGGTTMGSGVTIQGPVIIGENCVLEDCTIGPYVTIGSGSTIRQAHIEHSIILDHATITKRVHLAHSMIGKHVTIADTAAGPQRLIVGDKSILSY